MIFGLSARRHAGRRTMPYSKIALCALALVVGFPPIGFAANRHVRRHAGYAAIPTERINANGGRLIPAPAWSFACLSDAGPRECNQYIWVYGAYDAGAMGVR